MCQYKKNNNIDIKSIFEKETLTIIVIKLITIQI